MTACVFIIDTNVVVSGLIGSNRNSPPAIILDSMLSGSLFYLLSPDLLQEYRTVLLRPKLVKLHSLTENEIDQLLSEITANAIWREPVKIYRAPDIGDNHLWDLLQHSNDSILVTGDQLLIDKPPTDKSVISPASYQEVFN